MRATYWGWACLAFLAPGGLFADDWLQFRGPSGTAINDAAPLPVDWKDGKAVAWKVDLPGRGLSSPVIVGNKVIVTASSGPRQDKLHVLCYANDTGDLLWERRFEATGRSATHPKMSNATPTPASDGERVFAFFSSNDVLCLDLDGNLLWTRGLTYDYPNASNSLGMASSPVVADETLVVPVENDSESITVGLRVDTGESRWVLDRPRTANWTSPLVMEKPAGVVLQSSKGLHAIEPRTGKELWAYRDGASTIPSATLAANRVYVPSHGTTALEVTDASDSPKQLWRGEKLRPGTASSLVYGDKLLCLNSAGVLLCADAKTGDTRWQLRLQGPFTSSPVAGRDHLYATNEEGTCFVVSLAGKKGEIVSEWPLKETILATPSLAQGAVYQRSDHTLWKIFPADAP